MRAWNRRFGRFAAFTAFAVMGVGFSSGRAAETGAERAERLLAAMGGREAWAKVRFVHVEAEHDQLNVLESFTNRIWNDFARPRVRIEAKNDAIDVRRVIAGGAGALMRGGVRRELNAEEVAGEARWWEANIYRTLHRLAAGDPTLVPKAVGEHRLEIFLANGPRLNWFLLNQRGEPHQFGTWDSEQGTGTGMGPLAGNGTVKYPGWGIVPDGSWRYVIRKFETADAVPADVDFESP